MNEFQTLTNEDYACLISYKTHGTAPRQNKKIVQGILWDNACMFCSNDKCLENSYYFDGSQAYLSEPTRGCYKTKQECDELHIAGSHECDLTIYFTWTGTDKDGKPMLSSNNRFSMFKIKQLKDVFKDSLPRFPTITLPKWDKDIFSHDSE